METITLIQDIESNQFEQALLAGLEKAGFKHGLSVAVKIHMGEGKGMFLPVLAKRAVTVLNNIGCKPFLFDTPVVYPGPRKTKKGYEAHAALHGFTQKAIGCPIIISDTYKIVKRNHLDVEVSSEMAQAGAMLVLTHFKGHDCSGFGGSVKNLGMGCASPKSKGDQHSLGKPSVNENCTACGGCERVCPFNAIKVSEKCEINLSKCVGCGTCVINCPFKALESKVTFETLLCEAASAALVPFKNKPVFYVNDVRRMTKHCDCFGNPGNPIAKDVGILLGNDIIAMDKACLDLSAKQEGKNFFKEIHSHDPYLTIIEGEKQKMGRQEYKLA